VVLEGNCFHSLKIRRPSGLGGSTPPPGTSTKSRVGRGSRQYHSSENCKRLAALKVACDVLVTGRERTTTLLGEFQGAVSELLPQYVPRGVRILVRL
jgi:hypothetical protein